MSNRSYLTRGLSGLCVAAIGVGFAWLLAAVISPDLYAKALGSDYEKVTLGTVLSVTIIDGGVGVLIGWLLFWRNKPQAWWYVLVALVMILTTIEAIVWTKSNETMVWLLVFHVIAAAAIAPAVASTLPRSSERTTVRLAV